MQFRHYRRFTIALLAVALLPILATAQTQIEANSDQIEYGRGFVPPSGNIPDYTATRPAGGVAPASLPTRYDCREYGYVSPVKNQSVCGCCYAFTSVADVESRILVDGGGLYNFSENNAKECSYGAPSCGGGNYYMTANLFTTNGLVLETCDPYVANYDACETGCPSIVSMLDYSVISTTTIPNTEVLKTYVYTYGPIYTTIYAGNSDAWYTEMVTYDGSYTLYNTTTATTNHTVLIVGWDDTLSHAGGQGAWIIKNSWSTGWGGTCGYGAEGGYGTMAYGTASIGKWSSFMSGWQLHDDNEVLFYYNEGGWSGQVGYSNPTAWGMARFDAVDATNVNRIEFWTSDATTDIDIYIYDTFSGGTLSNLLASKLNSSFNDPGYHSVALDAPLAIGSGEDFFVAVKFTNSSYGYPLTYDSDGPTQAGKTYYSSNGSSWSDAGASGWDLTIRARTSTSVAGCSFTVTSPASGNEWAPDSLRTISWNSSGAGANVKLDLFEGATHRCTIEPSTANDGSYLWTVDLCSGSEGSNYRVRVCDDADTTCQAFSDYFSITIPCEIAVSSPTVGQECALDSSVTITWSSSGAAGNVNILLYKGAVQQCVIASGTANDGNHPWTVNHCGSGEDTDYRIRVIDAVDGGCWDFSDYFSIVSLCSLEVTSPSAGADLEADSSIAITWNSIAGGSNVNIFLYKGVAVQCTLAVATPDDGSFNWNVDECGGDNGSDYRIKIENADDPTCFDFGGDFTITVPCEITVTAPLISDDWLVGASETIIWSSGGAGSEVALALYQGSTWICDIDTMTDNDGSFAWTVTECGNGGAADYRVKVTSRADTDCFDYSELFTITIPCALQVTNPILGQTCYLDSNVTVEWTAQESGSLLGLVLFKQNDSLCFVDTVTALAGSYSWTATDCGAGPGGNYRFRLADLSDPDCFDFSAYFAVTEPCSIIVEAPVAGVEWVTGDTQTVLWSSGGAGANVRLDLYKSGGLIAPLESSIPNSGSYDWIVNDWTAGNGSDYQIRITDLSNPTCYDYSDFFRITVIALDVDAEENTLPSELALSQNYPNPFNPETQIDFRLPRSQRVRLTVYNVTGQPVRLLYDGVVSGGPQSVVWDGRNESGDPLPSGIYLYRLVSVDFSATRKMLLLK
ncbi:MAG: Ser-Thr-rich GPI-anchored membrane family protein [bacterium]